MRTAPLLPLRALAGLAAGVLLLSCERAPANVTTNDLESAAVLGKNKTLCRGLEMRDEDVRRYAAEKLNAVTDPVAQECVCKAISTGSFAERLGWDPKVVEGIQRTTRDDLASCAVAVAKKPDLKERAMAVGFLTTMTAPVARQALGEIAFDTATESSVRLRALEAIGGSPATKAEQIALLGKDPDAAVRKLAARGLAALVEPDVTEALRAAASTDADGTVRGAAMVGLKRHGVPQADELLCKAMVGDPSPEVRAVAVNAFKGTKKPENVACLRAAALTEQADADVRAAILGALKGTAGPEASKALCDAIPFWVKTYLKEGMVDKVPSSDIIRAQNDRDWERSYACVEAAQRQAGGYSCYGKKYVASWIKELGGNSFEPKCPGYND